MAIIRTNSSIAAPITGTLLRDGLRAAIQNTGIGARIDDYTSGNETRDVYQQDYGTALTYSNAFIETRINTLTMMISLALYHSFNTTTNTGSANPAVTQNNMVINTATSVNFVSLDGGAEFRMVLVIQGSTIGVLALVRPTLARPAWWTDSDYPYFFINRNITGISQLVQFDSTGGTALTPFSSITQEVRAAKVLGLNPNSRRQLVTGVQLQTSTGTNRGLIGQFSNDFALCSGTNALALDLIEVVPGVNEWLILNPAEGGLAVRIV